MSITDATAMLERPPAQTKRKAERQAEAADAFLPIVEQACKTLGLTPNRTFLELLAAEAARGYVPDESGVSASDASRLVAHAVATVSQMTGISAPASAGRMEAELLAEGEPVIAPGRGREVERELTPDEMRQREEKAATWARQVWASAGSERAQRYLAYLRDSPPMDVYNPEARELCINNVKMPLPAGMLPAKVAGRLPGRASAGPDGKPRWGCVAIADALASHAKARADEKAYQRYAHNIVIHGQDDEMADRREQAFEYGDLEVVGR